MYVYRIQDAEEREAPRNAIDYYFLARGGELVDDSTQKKQVDERPESSISISLLGRTVNSIPDQKGPWSRCYVCIPASEVDIMRCRYSVDVGTKEEEVNDDVCNLVVETGKSDMIRLKLERPQTLSRISSVQLPDMLIL